MNEKEVELAGRLVALESVARQVLVLVTALTGQPEETARFLVKGLRRQAMKATSLEPLEQQACIQALARICEDLGAQAAALKGEIEP